jgi:hypothetical protein
MNRPWYVKHYSSHGGRRWHIAAEEHPEFSDGSLKWDAEGRVRQLGESGLCGRLDPTDRYPEVQARSESSDGKQWLDNWVCKDCRRIDATLDDEEARS